MAVLQEHPVAFLRALFDHHRRLVSHTLAERKILELLGRIFVSLVQSLSKLLNVVVRIRTRRQNVHNWSRGAALGEYFVRPGSKWGDIVLVSHLMDDEVFNCVVHSVWPKYSDQQKALEGAEPVRISTREGCLFWLDLVVPILPVSFIINHIIE